MVGHCADDPGCCALRVKYAEYMLAAKVGYLTDLMRDTGGNVSEAARRGGMNRQHLTKLLARYKIVRASRPQGHRGDWSEFRA